MKRTGVAVPPQSGFPNWWVATPNWEANDLSVSLRLSFFRQNSLDTEECELVNGLLLLLRNILHAPDRPPSDEVVDVDTGADVESSLETTKVRPRPHRVVPWFLFIYFFTQIWFSSV